MSIVDQIQGNNSQNHNEFINEVAKYFMDFLETDFHKRRNPKRSIQTRNKNNLLIGLNIQKYPSFSKLVWKTVAHSFSSDVMRSIGKNVYRANIPQNLVDLIKLQVEKIEVNRIEEIILLVADEVEKAATLHKDEYYKALNYSIEESSKIVKSNLVLPFIKSLEKPIENLEIGDENNVYLMEEELTEILVSILENRISEVLKLLLSAEKVNIKEQLTEIFDFQDVKQNIIAFFESFKVGDLYSEIYEMERNRTILDKQEFYLNFCEITYERTKYPIFYIPFTVNRDNDSLLIEFDSQLYINKKAVEFITQEYNREKENSGRINSISERIVYLAQHQNDLADFINNILNEICNFFDLDKTIDITNSDPQNARSLLVRVSNACYITLFDKSDEALVNDYEDILQLLSDGNNVLVTAFNKLIQDFIFNNPISVSSEVEEEWDDQDTPDRLVFTSPIPLNSEQLQILSALKKHDSKYIIVEGPPGTGKSHTITAIAFNTILNNQSVLILSDKKEALDVVEDKITDTLNKVRLDKDFQNPILRLGKTGSTYSQILSSSSLENIKLHHRVIKNDHELLEDKVNKISNSLKEDIEAEIVSYGEIDTAEIFELTKLTSDYERTSYPFDSSELLSTQDSVIDIEELRKACFKIKTTFESIKSNTSNQRYYKLISFNHEEYDDPQSYKENVDFINDLKKMLGKLDEVYGESLHALSFFGDFSDKQLDHLYSFIKRYEDEKQWLFGYYFKKEKIAQLEFEFQKEFNIHGEVRLTKDIQKLKNIASILGYANQLKETIKENYVFDFDFLKLIHRCLTDDEAVSAYDLLTGVVAEIDFIQNFIEKHPNTSVDIGTKKDSLTTFIDNKLVNLSDTDFDRFIRFINLQQKLQSDFSKIPEYNYHELKKRIEELVTTEMTFQLDGRVIDFYENNKATAKTLREIIRTKQRFPKDEFIKLKNAFPCILAGIRDYAEYIPLEPEIFDLVIIDEASQVSIAQAFPALLRAKKVLILGDKKQFSNIKSTQARTDTNLEYLSNLKKCFLKNISSDTSELVKLDKFNIKTSILDFFEFISNYNAQLLKHFRGYKELISYSNKYFYQDKLQTMKIRGKPIEEVIKFTFIEHDGKQELLPKSNALEADFIINELQRLKEEESSESVGIITPHTNQQKLLVEQISKLPDKDYFYDKLKLKVMTFDTCQGEERDIIYYSMVASEVEDRLWGIFIKNLSEVDLEEDGKIKAQRLNVGFSRAKECMHFVLSKPIEKFNGSIREALQHYDWMLKEAKKEKTAEDTDSKSKMEPFVLNWFYQTKFWNEHKERIYFDTQFELGKYLKQLDIRYQHPEYKVDFLLVYIDELNIEHKIIIEYDGFQEHFKDVDEVNEFNYQEYYTDDDVFREKVLESYGYKFLRINKFNIGQNPIATLNSRLENIVKDRHDHDGVLNHIHQTITGLQNGDMKECPKCHEIRTQEEFKDSSLISGYGRFCVHCKQINEVTPKPKAQIVGNLLCPRCNSPMVLRNGRYGRFYGCRRFPYCKGTRQYAGVIYM